MLGESILVLQFVLASKYKIFFAALPFFNRKTNAKMNFDKAMADEHRYIELGQNLDKIQDIDAVTICHPSMGSKPITTLMLIVWLNPKEVLLRCGISFEPQFSIKISFDSTSKASQGTIRVYRLYPSVL